MSDQITNINPEIEKIKEEICDFYCKYPFEYQDNEILEIICDKCPLNRLDEVIV